jgi:hypothetical protein
VRGVAKHEYFFDKNVTGPLFVDNKKFQFPERMIRGDCPPVAGMWCL